MIFITEKKRLIKSKHINQDIKSIGSELSDKPLVVIGKTLVDMADVIKKKYQYVFKGVLDINRTISKVAAV
jgi:hypothetical protein